MTEKINEMIHEYKGSSSSSDSESERPSSHNARKKRLFGRKESVHKVLGGGKCMVSFTRIIAFVNCWLYLLRMIYTHFHQNLVKFVLCIISWDNVVIIWHVNDRLFYGNANSDLAIYILWRFIINYLYLWPIHIVFRIDGVRLQKFRFFFLKFLLVK